MKAPRLALLQRRFWSVVTAPEGVERALEELARTDPGIQPPTGWVGAGSTGEATARLEIYAGMYFFRLLEALCGDYPKLLELVGSEPFTGLAREYLTAHPSTDPSVRHVGGRLAGFLRGHALAEHFPYLPDLAAIEWARVEVFDRPSDTQQLSPAAVAGTPPERWPEMRFRAIEGLRLLELGYPADEIWLALDGGRPPEALPPQETGVLVWRKGYSILQRRVAIAEARALRLAIAGEPFASVCDALADPEEAARFLARWMHEGLLSGLRGDS